jgi:hypothetical protein
MNSIESGITRRNVQFVSPSSIREWLDSIEIPFLSGLKKFGESMGRGFDRFPVGNEGEPFVFTGENICVESSSLLYLGLKKEFGGRTQASIVNGIVQKVEYIPPSFGLKGQFRGKDLKHCWVRFIGSDGELYWIDGTVGQVRPTFRDQIMMGPVNLEQRVYGIYPGCVETITNEMLSVYGKRKMDFDSRAGKNALEAERLQNLVALERVFRI